MKTIPTTKATIEYLKKRLDDMPLDGNYEVSIKEIPVQMKENQRKMYFAWMTYLSQHFSGTKDDRYYYHECMKKEFLKPKKIKRFGFTENYYTIKGMDKKQFHEYMVQVEEKCNSMDIELPKILGKQYDKLIAVYGDGGKTFNG